MNHFLSNRLVAINLWKNKMHFLSTHSYNLTSWSKKGLDTQEADTYLTEGPANQPSLHSTQTGAREVHFPPSQRPPTHCYSTIEFARSINIQATANKKLNLRKY